MKVCFEVPKRLKITVCQTSSRPERSQDFFQVTFRFATNKHRSRTRR